MSEVTLLHLVKCLSGSPSAEVCLSTPTGAVRTDSRQVTPGDLFWALPGHTSDGHDFLQHAMNRGASCCVVCDDRPEFAGTPRIVVQDSLKALALYATWRRQQSGAMVIGITGSVGKTTTRAMLHSVLSTRFTGKQSPANFNNHVGVPLSLTPLTPADEFAVIEMGASAEGEIRHLARIAQPEAAIITAVAPAHLDGFGSMDAIIRTKGELVEEVPAEGFVILNGDDPHVREYRHRARCRTILVGESADNDLIATSVEVSNSGLSVTCDGMTFRTGVTGRQFVVPVLACIAVGREIGLTDDEIAEGLARFEPVSGRGRPQTIGQWTVLDETYNASPASMAAACRTLQDWKCTGQKWLVLGDMLALGELATQYHQELGELAGCCGFDRILTLGQYSNLVKMAAIQAGHPAQCISSGESINDLLKHLKAGLKSGDTVLVKGSRGMQLERVIDGLRLMASGAAPSRNRRAA